MKKPFVFSFIFILMAMNACGGDSTETPPETASTVTLTEYTVEASPATVAAGSVQFNTRNTGTIPHELVIIKTDLAADQLPQSEGSVTEDAEGLERIGEIEEFAAGQSRSASFDLDAGKYVLICNIPGHYQLGMRTAFSVRG